MSFRVAVVVIAFTLGMMNSILSQAKSRATISVSEVQVNKSLSVQLKLSSPDADLYVPYCWESEDGTRRLCNHPSFIEILTKEGWQSVKLRTRDAVLGGVPERYWKIQLIPAGQETEFTFVISLNDFAITHGQRLRFVLEAWHNEKAIKSGEKPTLIVSSSFSCP